MLRLSPRGMEEKALILKGGAQRRKWQNPTSNGQLLQNKMYTKKRKHSSLEFTDLSHFTIVEPNSELNINMIVYNDSDVHQHKNSSAESFMEICLPSRSLQEQ